MPYEALIEAISENRPLVLLLGQGALGLETGKDPLLKDALHRLGHAHTEADQTSYRNLLTDGAAADVAYFEWLAARAEKISPPTWLTTVAGVPWNAVFTSCLDTTATKAFRNRWRRVEPVTSGEQVPPDPRHRTELHITYLFGRLANFAEDQRPPRSQSDMRVRRIRHAIPLLNRLPDTVTPLGLLLIEGLDPTTDWLDSEDLSGVLQQFGIGQVHWFSWRGLGQHARPAGLGDLISSGVIVPYEASLARVLEQLAADGLVALHTPPRGAIFDRALTLGDTIVAIPDEISLSVADTVLILEDKSFAPPTPLSEERTYAEFRKFLGNLGDATSLMHGIKRGFALRRDFEQDLITTVGKFLAAVSQLTRPIILHGQSSTGKTVALARLAYDIRAGRRYPVLFSSQPGHLPTATDLDMFCQFVEQNGAEATLLIIDANADIDRYFQLRQSLASRGRNVIVVGSSYVIENAIPKRTAKATNSPFIYAPPELSTTEINALHGLIERFLPGTSPLGGHRAVPLDNGNFFLALLYRLFPETRYPISIGLGQEAAVTEDKLRQRGRGTIPERRLGTLGEALRKAGVEASASILEEAIEEIAGEAIDRAGKLVFLVMVPGRLGLRVPIDLLVRTVGREDIETVIALFEGFDLFRWYEDAAGELYIQPRLTLEARLICNRRLGGPQGEMEFAQQLLENVKSTGEERGVEIRFARNLSHAMGPNGLEKERYDRFYEQIADVLSELRSRRSIVDIGLMLQEAMLRREYVRIFQDDDEVRTTALQLLEKNVATLQEALRVAPMGQGKRRQRNSLIVELATTYGYLARQASKEGHPVSEVLKQYRQARGCARKANQADPDNYYPVDVNLWSALDVLDDDRLDLESRAELQADIFDAMERVDEDSLDTAQVVRLQTRRQKAGLAFQDAALEENAFARLIEVGSKAGFLLRARQIVGDTPRREPISADVLTCVKKATEFLLSRWDDIKDDSRCLFYLLKLWWIQHTETILFKRERRLLPRTDELVWVALRIVDAIIICDGVDASPRIRYLAAVFNWKLMNYEDARQIWNLLAQDTDFSYSRRVRKQHILADGSGKPQRFEGQIQWLDHTGRRARVLVEALRQEIDLFLSDFGIAEPRKGMAVPTFHIAFNFIGPIADPIRFYRA